MQLASVYLRVMKFQVFTVWESSVLIISIMYIDSSLLMILWENWAPPTSNTNLKNLIIMINTNTE